MRTGDADNDGKLPQMLILEMQGEFEHNQLEPHEFNHQLLGTLTEKTPGNYELVVQNHILKGKKSLLPSPMLFTERVKNPTTGEVEIQVKAIVREKVLFPTRPTPFRMLGQKLTPAQ